jgi:hypothetical protein
MDSLSDIATEIRIVKGVDTLPPHLAPYGNVSPTYLGSWKHRPKSTHFYNTTRLLAGKGSKYEI